MGFRYLDSIVEMFFLLKSNMYRFLYALFAYELILEFSFYMIDFEYVVKIFIIGFKSFKILNFLFL